MNHVAHKLEYYRTPEHPCNYLPDRQARTVVVDPFYPLDSSFYSLLAANGFRRSGSYIYRPACGHCQACVPVRIDAKKFIMQRNHRRIWQRNRDISIEILPPAFRDDHFELYRRYISARHKNGGMDNPAPEDYMQFLTCDWAQTKFIEMRFAGQLVGVAVTDILDDSLSAVYTFFAPEAHKRSPGIFAILYQIHDTVSRGLDWLYLGYWIDECDKMRYKNSFPAVQYFHNNCWSTRKPGKHP